MMNDPPELSPMERALYDAIERASPRTLGAEELAAAAYANRRRPENWYGSIIATMRNLSMKSEWMPKKVRRVSPKGRGSKARYICEPHFREIKD